MRSAPRQYFKVTDPEISKVLKGWNNRYLDASQEIEKYLRKVTGIIGNETPFYKTDDEGMIESISLRYAMGWYHDGWVGIEHTNWLIPESDKVKQEVRQLPRLPSHWEVNVLINWPEVKYDKKSADVHIKGLGRFAASANRQVRVSQSNGDMYLSVPVADMFSSYPGYAERVGAWQPPEFLAPISRAEGKRIERMNDFSRSVVGGLIKRAIGKGIDLIPQGR